MMNIFIKKKTENVSIFVRYGLMRESSLSSQPAASTTTFTFASPNPNKLYFLPIIS